LYQGEATITRGDGGQVTADVAIWDDDGGVHSSWGGRAVVRLPESLINNLGSNCMIRWPATGGGYTVGEFVLSAGQVGEQTETFRLAGSGELTEVPAKA
jgi:hypothetical protein